MISNPLIPQMTLRNNSSSQQKIGRKSIELIDFRYHDIAKSNCQLLDRLVAISNRKSSVTANNPQLINRNSISLNRKDYLKRCRDMKNRAIEVQNLRIMEKLMNGKSTYDRNKVHKQVKAYQKLKYQLKHNNRKFLRSKIQPLKIDQRKSLGQIKINLQLKDLQSKRVTTEASFKNQFSTDQYITIHQEQSKIAEKHKVVMEIVDEEGNQ